MHIISILIYLFISLCNLSRFINHLVQTITSVSQHRDIDTRAGIDIDADIVAVLLSSKDKTLREIGRRCRLARDSILNYFDQGHGEVKQRSRRGNRYNSNDSNDSNKSDSDSDSDSDCSRMNFIRSNNSNSNSNSNGKGRRRGPRLSISDESFEPR